MKIDLRNWKSVDLKKHRGRQAPDCDVRISISNKDNSPNRVVITFYKELSEKMAGKLIKPYVLKNLGMMCFVEDSEGAVVSVLKNSKPDAPSRITYTTEWFLLYCLDKAGCYDVHYDDNNIPFIHFAERRG